MSDIYDQHTAAFAHVSASVILDAEGKKVGTIAFKFPRGTSTRVYCYLHILGTEMVRGYAGGGGYDKASAAADAARRRIIPFDRYQLEEAIKNSAEAPRHPIAEAFSKTRLDTGSGWQRAIEELGYRTVQAV